MNAPTLKIRRKKNEQYNVQLPALINTLKDIAAALSRSIPSAISFPADPRFLTSLYYGAVSYTHLDSHLSRLETLDLLEASKQNYQGVARLGIEALALKVQGMRITDIAALYQKIPD